MKKLICMLIAAILLFAFGSTLYTAATPGPTKPKFTVELDTHTIDVGEQVWTFLYITNPSKQMEVVPPSPGTILHSVTVNYLNVTMNNEWVTFYSNGTICDKDGCSYSEHFKARWNPVVYPFETSLVFYVGYGLGETGNYIFTYTLNVDFEGENYDLVNTFQVKVF